MQALAHERHVLLSKQIMLDMQTASMQKTAKFQV
jgi:hypothetical protein